MNYAIKTNRGYIAQNQSRHEDALKLPVFTPERASARWYTSESRAQHAARVSFGLVDFEIQHVAA